MSRRAQIQRVLEALKLAAAFDFVATRDDARRGKPHPAIYLAVAGELGAAPAECLVIEDSPSGVRAALGAGMACLAVATEFTRRSMRAAKLLDAQRLFTFIPTGPGAVRAGRQTHTPNKEAKTWNWR